MIFSKPKVGVALSGGGAKGLAHIGALEMLVKEGIKIDAVAGTSIGAVVGAVYALNPDIEFLKKKAEELVSSDAFKELGLDKFSKERGGWLATLKNRLKDSIAIAESFFKSSLIPLDKTEKVFKDIFEDRKFSETKIPFATVALDLISGEDVIMKEGYLWQAVQASAAIPGIFPVVKKDGMMLVDGGVTANVPINALFELGVDVVIAVIFGKQPSPPGDYNTAIEVILRSDELAKFKLFRLLLDRADVVVEIDVKELHWTNFSELDFCIQRGKEAVLKKIDKIRYVTSRFYYFKKKFFGKNKVM